MINTRILSLLSRVCLYEAYFIKLALVSARYPAVVQTRYTAPGSLACLYPAFFCFQAGYLWYCMHVVEHRL